MIGRIRGIIIEKKPPLVMVEVVGVGYEIQASMNTFYQLPSEGVEVILHTHFVVREDAQLLYGFHSLRERSLFRSLIKVNGVGPKLALAILSGIDLDSFIQCVMASDSATLVRVPGVGKKTAERLIVEMRDKLANFDVPAADMAQTGNSPIMVAAPANAKQDAVSALVSLGYKPLEASKAIGRIYQADLTSEALIKQALQLAICN